MTTQTTRLHLPTPELQIGDTVLTHGMRVRLDDPPLITQQDREVYSWLGQVTNAVEVLESGAVPRTFLADGTWNVQGNDLAMWAVERAI